MNEEPFEICVDSEERIRDFDTLVLSGGGIHGIMYLGALQAADDKFLLGGVNKYIGTSIGSIICYLLAIWYNANEIMTYFCSNRVTENLDTFNIMNFMECSGGISFHPIQEHLEKMTMSKISDFLTLKDLKDKFGKTLICSTYNITDAKVVYLGPDTHPRLPCLTAIKMSSSIPLIFKNCMYRDCLYVDGFISNNFPIAIGDKIGKKVLGIATALDNKIEGSNIRILEMIMKLMRVPVEQATKYRIQNSSDKCTVVMLTSDISNLTFNVSTKDKFKMYDEGYNAIVKRFS